MQPTKQRVHLLITGGTIDSVFDAAKDMVVVNDASTISVYLEKLVRPHFELSQEVITLRDSREITDNIRAEIVRSIEKCGSEHILVTHGTYTMSATAAYLQKHSRIIQSGSFSPALCFLFRDSHQPMHHSIWVSR